MKLNEEEVRTVGALLGRDDHSDGEFCRKAAKQCEWEAVCVTRGARGCALLIGGEYAEVEGYTVQVTDTVGSGDAFAAAFIHGLSSNWPPGSIGDFANRVGALVASRAGAIPDWTIDECEALARSSNHHDGHAAANKVF